ncbi:hypothetical protein ACVD4U_004288 [Vibrio vulnificus]|uniref:hypothetical protein n=1 Tax=Vibrio vulnificus TaxID=672 RepID=UPI000CA2E4EC|nr:hypothetical protein [Vibrio vulnificus]AUL95806.1 hypothetical protein FORC54_1661 [Vibrio vulnificus]
MENYTKYFERLVMFLVALIVLGVAVSIFAYRSVFNGDLSTLAADWGDAGGFFGGIFTPVIAFATLLAIVVTIQLQKKLLDTQNRDFTKLYNLQREELDLFRKQTVNQSFNEQKKIYLNLLEQQIEIRRCNLDRASDGAMFMLEKHDEGFPIEKSVIEENIVQKERLEKQIQVLTYFSIGFTLQKFDSIAEMDKSITRLFKLIDNPENLESLYASNGETFDFVG